MTPYEQQSREQVAQREDYLILMERVRRVEGRLEGQEMQMEALRREIEGGRRGAQDATRGDLETLRSAVTSLQSQLSALEKAREQDRKEVVERLSQKITQVMGSQPAATAVQPTGTRSEFGYEHVVAAGETLSRIAQAYNVTSKAIIEANALRNPDQLHVGQKLFIPQ